MARSHFIYGVLLLLPIAVAAPYILDGALPLDLRLPLTQPPWEDARPEGLDTGFSDAAQRHATQTYPWYRFIRNAGEEGFLPLWNPLEGMGYPFLAAWITRALSPFSLPVYFLPLEYGLWCALLLKLIVAGWGMQCLARRIGLTPGAAFCAALAYQWSAGVYGAFDAPASDVLAWLPLFILGLDGIATGKPRAWAFAALIWGLMLLGGAPQLVLPLLLFGIAYIFLRGVPGAGKGARVPMLRAALLWMVLGAGLAAAQLLPFAEFLRHGTLAEEVTATSGWPGVLPVLAYVLFPLGEHTGIQLFYVGAPQWLLLPLWFSVRRFAHAKQRRIIESLLLSAVLLCLVEVLFVFVPVVSERLGPLAPAFLAFGLAPALALMTAAAIQTWIELDPDEAKSALKRLLGLLPLFWCYSLVVALLSYQRGMVASGDLGVLFGSAALLFVVLVITLLRPRRALIVSSVAVLTFASLLLGHRPAFPFTPAAQAFPETDFTASLREVGGRVGGSGALRAWPLAGSGLPQLFSTSGIRLKRYEQFMDAAAREPRLLRRAAAGSLLFTRDDIQGDYADLRPHLRIAAVYPSGAVLFRDLEACTEARVVPRVREIQEFSAGQLQAGREPLYEGSAPAYVDGAEQDSPAEVTRTANPSALTVSHASGTPGVLVLADAFYPGWTASAAGKSLPVYAVDGLFRGVNVGSGPREVHFSYRPASFRLGAIISALSLMLILLATYWPRPKPASAWPH